jgi:hypothetical protein
VLRNGVKQLSQALAIRNAPKNATRRLE